jgi:hypothetical protein
MVLVRTQNITLGNGDKSQSIQNIASALSSIVGIVGLGIGLVKTISRFLPAFTSIQQSKQVSDSLGQFIDQFKANRVLREAIKEKIKLEYKQAPEFFNLLINDNVERLNLYDPYDFGLVLLHQRPKCQAIFSGNCKNEHIDWMNRVQQFVNYIQDLASRMGEAIKQFQYQTGKNFDALDYQEQVNYLIGKTPSKNGTQSPVYKSGFELRPEIIYVFLGTIILVLLINKTQK